MAHALAPDARQGHFDTALLTDNAAILDALVLAAKALIVLHGAKYACTEEAIALRLECPVVDGLGFLDLAG